MIKGDLFIIRETAQILIGAKVHCQSTPEESEAGGAASGWRLRRFCPSKRTPLQT